MKNLECSMTPDLICRFVLWLPKPSATLADRQKQRVRRVVEAVNLTCLEEMPFFLACDTTSSLAFSPDAPRSWLDIQPGKRKSGRNFTVTDRTLHALTEHAEEQAQIFNLLHWLENKLTIVSDPVGIKGLHYVEDESGWWLASRIVDLIAIEPSWARPIDWIGLQSLFLFRAVYCNRTLHERIKRVPSGAVIEWSPMSGPTLSRSRRLRVAAENPFHDMKTFSISARAALQESYRRLLANRVGPTALALSGGYDSRLLAAVGQSAGASLQCYSYGRWFQDDTFYAWRVAQTLNLPFKRVDFHRNETLDKLASRTALMEGCGDVMAGQTALTEHPDFRQGDSLIHGFAGDTTSGAFIDRLPFDAYKSRETLAAGFLSYSKSNKIDAERLFGKAFDPESLQANIVEELDDSQSLLHACNLFWLENHKKRFVSGLCVNLGETFDLVMPLYDRSYFDAWGALPRIGLEYRAALKYWLAKDYPEIAKIPHATAGLITPNLRNELIGYFYDFPYKSIEKILGQRTADKFLNARGWSRTTYHVHNLLAEDQQAEMHRRIETMRTSLASILNINLAPDYWSQLEGRWQARRILLGLAAYSSYLDDHLKRINH